MKAFLQFLQRAFKYFRSTKRVWRRPPRASLLIIDRGTASPLDEMFAPTRGQSQRDLREPTGGEFSGGVIQERGRPMSDVMKRAKGKVNLKPKKKGRETVVQRDARRIRKNRDLAGLIEGLPG